MLGLIGSVISSAAKIGYDQYKRNQNRSEKREFLDYTNQANYGYYLRSLRESPSAQREGLERAGYNPMLALGHIGSSSYGGASVSSGDIHTDGDIVSSAKEGANLENDIARSFDDAHDKSQAETDLLESDAKTRQSQADNDFLRTLSQLENDAVEREVKRSQINKNNADTTKTKVDTISEPLSDAGKMGIGAGAVVGGKSLAKFAKKYLPRIAPMLSGSTAQIGSTALAGAGISTLPLLIGSAGYAGWQAQKSKTGRRLAEDEKVKHGNWSR